jgi:AraC family transcriptional regulator, regulatory protein of adaptative response / DNA-3-methyladenine glycosylase II
VNLDANACYRALTARDGRFDGLFFVGVRTTGIYCRPVCRARTPGRDRCVFYRTAAEAERDGFRACFRCRPELAPGSAPVDSVPRLVREAVARIDAGALNDGDVEGLAGELGVTARHLRRAMMSELGVSPIEWAQTRRVGLATRLLHDTALPVSEVAFASGFRSLRRFNALFRARFGRAPGALRKARRAAAPAEAISLTLDYRAPYDWSSLLAFVAPRATPGVETVCGDIWMRTVRLGSHRGWISVSPAADRHALRAKISVSLAPALMPLVFRLRRLFDLDAQPELIVGQLGSDPRLAPRVRARPGLRVPGAFDGVETAVRAVLGQQISVAAATTLAGRVASSLGDPIETPHPELSRLSPTVERLAGASVESLSALGVLPARARTVRALATAALRGELVLSGTSVPEALRQLEDVSGVGPWTAQYVAMRALGWPDAFPESDLGLRRALGGVSASEARRRAERWRPWRAYAAMHLWVNP